MDLKQQILTKTAALFMRYGLKSITMDDIARELGISKKTLYQYVDNKTDLIEQIFRQRFDMEKVIMQQIQEQSLDAIDEILKIARYVIEELRQISPTTLYDLQKYYRSTWKLMEATHQEHIYNLIRGNLIRGMKDGNYRTNINPDIIAKLYVGKTSLVVDEDLFPVSEYNSGDLFTEYIYYHIHGVASPSGLQLLEQHLEKEKEKIST